MQNDHKFMRVIEKAVGQLTPDVSLLECIGEICDKEEIDIDEMSEWIKSFKGLLQTIEYNVKNHNMLKESVFKSICISDLF